VPSSARAAPARAALVGALGIVVSVRVWGFTRLGPSANRVKSRVVEGVWLRGSVHGGEGVALRVFARLGARGL